MHSYVRNDLRAVFRDLSSAVAVENAEKTRTVSVEVVNTHGN